jgi:hypothetical protein
VDPVQRYFADQFPVFVESGVHSGSPITLCYVDLLEASVAGFRHHLEVYKPLLSDLIEFRFLYVSKSTINFEVAERCFETVTSAVGGRSTTELFRYSTLRDRRDKGQNGSLSNDEITWLDQASRRFDSQKTECLYTAWRARKVADEGPLAKNIAETSHPPHSFEALPRPTRHDNRKRIKTIRRVRVK